MKRLSSWWLIVAITIASLLLGTFSTNVYAGEELIVNVIPDKAQASLGDNITYTYMITNMTSEDITALSLEDDKVGPMYLTITTLAPSENTTSTGTYLVKISDFPGPIKNTCTVTGTMPNGDNITATASALVDLTINKSLMTKAQILRARGVSGKGIGKSSGLQKLFNYKSHAAEHAGKKNKAAERAGKKGKERI